MLTNELTISAPAWGAALPDARAPWLTVEPSVTGQGRTHALQPCLGYTVSPALPSLLAAGATAVAGVLGANGVAGTSDVVEAKAATAGLPTDNLKQFNQMKTRVNVDHAGARGPEPERE